MKRTGKFFWICLLCTSLCINTLATNNLTISSLQFNSEEFLEINTTFNFTSLKIFTKNETSLEYSLISSGNYSTNSSILLIGSSFVSKYDNLFDSLDCQIWQSSKSQLIFGGFLAQGENFTLTFQNQNQTIYSENFTFESFPKIKENKSLKISKENNSYILEEREFGFCNYPFLEIINSIQNISNLTQIINITNQTYTNNSNNESLIENTQTTPEISSGNEDENNVNSNNNNNNNLETKLEILNSKKLSENEYEVEYLVSKGINSKRAVYFTLNNEKVFTTYLSKNSKNNGKIRLKLPLFGKNTFVISGLDLETKIFLNSTLNETIKKENNISNSTKKIILPSKFLLSFSDVQFKNNEFVFSTYSNKFLEINCSLYLHTKKKFDFKFRNISNATLISFSKPNTVELKNSTLYRLRCIYENEKNKTDFFSTPILFPKKNNNINISLEKNQTLISKHKVQINESLQIQKEEINNTPQTQKIFESEKSSSTKKYGLIILVIISVIITIVLLFFW